MQNIDLSIVPPYSLASSSLVIGGIYEHYKKKHYKILYICRHSETLEEMVVYQALYGEQGIWTRPLEMFVENITVEGMLLPRFRLVCSNGTTCVT